MVLPNFRWFSAQQISLNGVPAFARNFTAAQSLDQATMAFAVHSDKFQRVMTLSDRVVLSGLKAGQHWVAVIETDPKGVVGTVSTLPLTVKEAKASVAPEGDVVPGLAAKARLRFRQQVEHGKKSVTQEIYSSAMPAKEIVAYLESSLRKAGWYRQDDVAWLPGSQAWRRKERHLVVLSKSISGQTALFVHHF